MTEKISQVDQLYNILSDGLPHRTDELLRRVYGIDGRGFANLKGRISDVAKMYGVEFVDDKILPNGDVRHCRRDKDNPVLWWYQMKIKVVEEKSIWSPKHFLNVEMARQISLF